MVKELFFFFYRWYDIVAIYGCPKLTEFEPLGKVAWHRKSYFYCFVITFVGI